MKYVGAYVFVVIAMLVVNQIPEKLTDVEMYSGLFWAAVALVFYKLTDLCFPAK